MRLRLVEPVAAAAVGAEVFGVEEVEDIIPGPE